MYSSEEFERINFRYQTEAAPNGVSIEEYCSKNDVPYALFRKWYDDTHRKTVEVELLDAPPAKDTEEKAQSVVSSGQKEKPITLSFRGVEPVKLTVSIKASNGLHLQHKDIDYQALVYLIGKLEGLC